LPEGCCEGGETRGGVITSDIARFDGFQQFELWIHGKNENQVNEFNVGMFGELVGQSLITTRGLIQLKNLQSRA
jgi:hypothetical protein